VGKLWTQVKATKHMIIDPSGFSMGLDDFKKDCEETQ